MSLIPTAPNRRNRRSILTAPVLIRHAGMRWAWRNWRMARTVSCSMGFFTPTPPVVGNYSASCPHRGDPLGNGLDARDVRRGLERPHDGPDLLLIGDQGF